jgi:2-dehydropantoate 2-reductase
MAAHLRRDGMRLRLAGGEHTLAEPDVAGSLNEALGHGPFDVALFALKSFDTETALEAMLPFSQQLPPVLCLQNGVDNEPRIAAALGADKVIAGTVTSAIGRGGLGNIALERLRGVGIADGHPLSGRLAETFERAGLRPRLYPRAADMKWSKLLTNLLANATSAILDLTPAQIFADPRLYRIEMVQMREALAVMSALGARVVDLPGTPVRLLALGVHLPGVIARPLMQRAVGGGRGGKMPSFHIDLHTGRSQSEVEYLNGAVWRYGAQLNLSTPVNRLLTETLLALTRGEEPVEAWRNKREKLLDRLAIGAPKKQTSARM